MTSRTGRVFVGGEDRGGATALGPSVVLTAQHVVRDRGDAPVEYRTADGGAIQAERIDEATELDAAVLHFAADLPDWLPLATTNRGAGWRVESVKGGTNDPVLTGTITEPHLRITDASDRDAPVLQLEVDQDLGSYAGYSGSGVLDSVALAVVGLLVEQKPLRLPGRLGQPKPASNVLYAIPIDAALAALRLDVGVARPLRFHGALSPGGMVTRADLLDQTVRSTVGAVAAGETAPLVLLRGPGGIGKSVLARQMARDVRIWTSFPDGIVMLPVGQGALVDDVATELRSILGVPTDRSLTDALDAQRVLIILDDVWSRDLLSALCDNLPPNVTVAATTRGVSLAGATDVRVGAASSREAIQMLARETPTPPELESALGDLAETLFRWPLLLGLAAAEIHNDDRLDWELVAPLEPASAEAGPEVDTDEMIRRANAIRSDFPDDPTMLDDLERSGSDQPPRSVDVLVHRSLDRIDDDDEDRFALISIYPPGVPLVQRMLEDLWAADERDTGKRMLLFVRVGLAEVVAARPPTIQLHDLIDAWVRHERPLPHDVAEAGHRRLAGLSIDADGDSRELQPARVEWLSHHLTHSGDPVAPSVLLSSRWRLAYRNATGTDATYLHALRDVIRHFTDLGHRSELPVDERSQHRGRAVVAALLHAYAAAAAANISVDALCAQALLGERAQAFRQAACWPDPGSAADAMIELMSDLARRGRLTSDAIEIAANEIGELRDVGARVAALASLVSSAYEVQADQRAGLAELLLTWLPGLPPHEDSCERIVACASLLVDAPAVARRLLDSAATLARKIRHGKDHARALCAVAAAVAERGEVEEAEELWNEALVAVRGVGNEAVKSIETAFVAGSIGDVDPVRSQDLFRQAMAGAAAIPDDWRRSFASDAVGGLLLRSDAEAAAAFALTTPPSSARDTRLGRTGVALAGEGNWSGAMRLAEAIHDPSDRNAALARIAVAASSRFPTEARDVFDAAVDGMRHIGDVSHRFELIAEAAGAASGPWPDVAHDLFDSVIEAADSFPDDRNPILRAVVNASVTTDPELALRAARLIDGQHRSHSLLAVQRRMVDDSPRAALSVLEDMSEPAPRRQGLAMLARSIALEEPDMARRMLEEVQELSGRLDGNDWRLADVVDAMAPVAPEVAAQMLNQITYPLALAKPLTSLGEAVFTSDAARGTEYFRAALELTRGARIEYHLAPALRTVCRYAPDLANEVVAEVAPDADRFDAERLAIAIASALPDVAKRLIDASGLPPTSHGIALARMAAAMGEESAAERREIFESSISMTEGLRDPRERANTLAMIAAVMKETEPARACEVAETVADLVDSDYLRRHVVSALAGVDPARARQISDGIRDDVERGVSLAELSIGMASIDPQAARPMLVATIDVMTARAPGTRVIGLSSSTGWPAEALAAALLKVCDGNMAQVIGYVAKVPRDRSRRALEKSLAAALVPNTYSVSDVVLHGYLEGLVEVEHHIDEEEDAWRLQGVELALQYTRGFLVAQARVQPEAAVTVAKDVAEIALRF